MIFEVLEKRQLLSVSLNPATGLLTVTGTNFADRITVERCGRVLSVFDGKTQRPYALNKVKSVSVDALAGRDKVLVAANVNVPTVLNGGPDNDTIRGGAAADRIVGGEGDDLLDGAGGADVFEGGTGTDTADYSGRCENLSLRIGAGAVSGQSGENDDIGGDVENLIGGRGNDLLAGSIAANLLRGMAGNDTLEGNDGADISDGDGGNDTYRFIATASSQSVRVRERNGGGKDTLDFTALDASTPVTVNLSNATLATYTGTVVSAYAAGQEAFIENVLGGAGDDSITGNKANNKLAGNDGNDSFDGVGGGDDMSGGAGSDTADYSLRTAAVFVSANDVPNDGQAGEKDNVHGDIEQIVGGTGADELSGAANGSILVGNAGKNTLNGGAGDDVIFAGPDGDRVVGNGGADVVIGGAGNDTIFAGDGSGNPLANGAVTGAAVIFAGGGNDSVVGGTGDDQIDGQGGDDTVHGGAGGDTVSGEDGKDYLFGDAGNDSLDGGIDDDSIGGGTGQDTVAAGDGNDLVQKDLPDPVTGVVATASLSMSSAWVLSGVEIISSDEPVDPDPHEPSTDPGPGDFIDGGTGNDTLGGSLANDEINGGDGADCISGGDGHDILNGENGNNTILGGEGDDTISAGFGNNDMEGQGGNDFFVNANGFGDTVAGGDGVNAAQFEPSGFDTLSDIEIISDPDSTIVISSIPVDGAGGPFDQLTPVDGGAVYGAVYDGGSLVTSAVSSDGAGNVTINDAGATTGVTISVTQNATSTTITDNGVVTVLPNAQVKRLIITTGSGDDNISLFGVNATSSINSGAGNDTVTGGNLGDTVVGGVGNDCLIGLSGDDVLRAGVGNDQVFGGPGTDYVNGGDVGFFYAGGDGTDFIRGGDGNDYAEYQYRSDGLTLRLDGTARSGGIGENDTINTDVENVLSGAGNDTIIGNELANCLTGGDGADSIFGNGGVDAILGSRGSDRVYGGAGFDNLYLSGDATADGYNVGGLAAEFVQRDTAPADFVTASVAPPA